MKIFIASLLLLFASVTTYAQIGVGTLTPHPSAALDITATNKGFLPPRMTMAQIKAIPNPVAGLTAYDVGARALRVYDGYSWTLLAPKTNGSLADAPGAFASFPVGDNRFLNVTSLCLLADKSLIVAGQSSETCDVFGVTVTAKTWMAQLDSNGTLVWMRQFTGINTAYSMAIATIKADPLGSGFFIGGNFFGNVDFNPGAGLSDATSVSQDAFIARFTNSGIFTWKNIIGGADAQGLNCLEVGDGGFLFAGGTYRHTLVVGSNTYTTTGTNEGWAARFLTGSGSPSSWVFRIGDGTSASESVTGIALRDQTNLLICGNFNNTATYFTNANAGSTITAAGSSDGFLLALTPGGTLGTMYRLGGTGSDRFTDLAATPNTIILGGSFSDTVNFTLNGGSPKTLGSHGGLDGFVVTYFGTSLTPSVVHYAGPGQETVLRSIRLNNGEIVVQGKGESPKAYNDNNLLFSYSSYGQSNSASGDAFLSLLSSTRGNWMAHTGSIDGSTPKDIAASADGQVIYSVVSEASTPYLTYDGTRINAGTLYLTRYEE